MREKVEKSKKHMWISLFLSMLLLMTTFSAPVFAAGSNRICGYLKLENSKLAPAGGISAKVYVANADGTIAKYVSVKILENKNSVFYDINYLPNGSYYIYYEMNFIPQYEPKAYYVLGSGGRSGWTVLTKPQYPQSVYNQQITNADITVLEAKNNRAITGKISFPSPVESEYGMDIEVIALQEVAANSFQKISSSTVHVDKGQLSADYWIVVPNQDNKYIVKYSLKYYQGLEYRKEGYYSSTGTVPPVNGGIPVNTATRITPSIFNINMTVLKNILGNATTTIISPQDNAAFKSGPVLINGTAADIEEGVTEVDVVVKNETTGKYMTSYQTFQNSDGVVEWYDKATYSNGNWSLNLSGTFEPGNYIIKAYAYDGQISTVPTVSKFVITARRNATAVITSLQDGAVLQAGPVSISGTASDPDGLNDLTGVKVTIGARIDGNVVFYDDATKSWVAGRVPFNSTVYSNGSWSLDLTGVSFPAGEYCITAYADDGDIGAASQQVTFTIVP